MARSADRSSTPTRASPAGYSPARSARRSWEAEMAGAIDIDRFCPTATDDPFWNESCWFSFSIPEREIHGMVYYFFRPNMNLLMGGPIVWDGSGANTWDCLYH